MGLIIEKISVQSFANFFQEQICGTKSFDAHTIE
jgi:hypothetical protein